MSNIFPCVTDAGVVNLGRDALGVLIHTQGIGDNPSKSASTQKDQSLKVKRRAKFKIQRSRLSYGLW